MLSLRKITQSLERLHSMRGNKLVQAARNKFAIDKTPLPPAILPLYNWFELAATQGQLKHGAVVALEGRTTDGPKPWRRILLRMNTNEREVHLFDRWSRLLDESEDGVPHGRLAIKKFVQEFDEAGGNKYRPAQLVQEHRDERGPDEVDIEYNVLSRMVQVCAHMSYVVEMT